jgi:hypothetical protein
MFVPIIVLVNRVFRVAGLALALLLCACTPLISPYDHTAYQNATSLKAETLALADKAVEPFGKHEARVDTLLLQVEKAYEYSKGLPGNSVASTQWEIIKDPGGNLLGGLVATWKEQGRVSKTYASEKKGQLARAFDYVICLEMNKKQSSVCVK